MNQVSHLTQPQTAIPKKEIFTMKTTITLFVFLTIFSLNTFAQDIPFIIFEGHTSSVNSISFSPDGKTLASGSFDETIRLWDVATRKVIRTLKGHTDPVRSVAFSPDGSTIASGSGIWRGDGDNTIRLWDTETGNHIHTLTEHAEPVRNVAFSPDGSTIASGSQDYTIRLWDAETGNHIHTLIGHTDYVNSVAFSSDGQTLASGSGNSTIRLWDVGTRAVKRTLNTHSNYSILSLSFSPDGQMLASGSARTDHSGYRPRRLGRIRLWDVDTGALKHTLTGHEDFVNSVAFSPDGKTLASGGSDGTIKLWDVSTGLIKHTFTGHTERVTSVAFSPNGTTLASGSADDTIRFWKLFTTVNITPSQAESPAIEEQFLVNVSIVGGENVGGYQFTLEFDSTALRYVSSINGDYLPPGAFFVPPVVSGNKVTLGATSLAGVSSGDGTLATVTFEIIDVTESVLNLSEVILTDSEGEHLPHLAYGAEVIEPDLLPSSGVVTLMPSSVLSPAVGEQLTFNVDITGGQNVADFQLTFDYDPSALRYISSPSGNYLAGGVGNGDGTLETVTFEVLDVKASTVSVSGYLIATNGLRYLPTFESAEVVVPIFGDVNRDGSVNILDLVLVASKFGQRVSGDPADVNEDSVVNIVDLVKVAGAIGGGAAAPSVWNLDLKTAPTRADVQNWLSQAQQLNLTDPTSQRGILFLENLLAALTPKETSLLPNYPNPFNPETWIPYQLAEPADVTVTIYAVDGAVVRTLMSGHHPIGIYQDKSRAAYWDGRNALGEPVASGIYFYTFTAGEFTATRKMLIMK